MTDNTRQAALVIGASGGIGSAVVDHFLADPSFDTVIAVSRSPNAPSALADAPQLRWLQCDSTDSTITDCIASLKPYSGALTHIVITCGVLHTDSLQPEKSLEQLTSDTMLEVLRTNLVVPTLWLAGLASLFSRSSTSTIAVLSARVGSIADNGLGGWYSYRSSKAGLNMALKTTSIELARRAPGVKLVAFHPGTTDTPLSKPFQRNVPDKKLFTPAFVATRLVATMASLPRDATLSFLDWDGKTIPW